MNCGMNHRDDFPPSPRDWCHIGVMNRSKPEEPRGEQDPPLESLLSDFISYAVNRPRSKFPLLESVELEGEVWNTYSRSSPAHIGELNSREKLSGATWTALVIRQNHFVFQNHQNPLHDVLFPIVRSSFEHAVYLWLLARDRADDNSLRQLDRRALKHWQRIFDGPGEDVPLSVARSLPKLVQKLMPTYREKRPSVLIFEQVCQNFENGAGLYENYGRLSSLTHPSIQSGSLFVADILGRNSRLARVVEDDTRLSNLLRMSLISAGSDSRLTTRFSARRNSR